MTQIKKEAIERLIRWTRARHKPFGTRNERRAAEKERERKHQTSEREFACGIFTTIQLAHDRFFFNLKIDALKIWNFKFGGLIIFLSEILFFFLVKLRYKAFKLYLHLAVNKMDFKNCGFILDAKFFLFFLFFTEICEKYPRKWSI